MDKQSIRKIYLQKRKALSHNDMIKSSKDICNAVINLEHYKKAQTISLYMPIKNEVDTNIIWQDAINKNKNCYFPKVTDKNSMIFLPADKLEHFAKNKWGILEPTTKIIKSLPVNKLDIMIVPIVAFDSAGNRIGMGKGFFDKALEVHSRISMQSSNKEHLKNFNTTPILIGVAYEFQKIPLIKSETWDIKLDIIVTEKTVYYV